MTRDIGNDNDPADAWADHERSEDKPVRKTCNGSGGWGSHGAGGGGMSHTQKAECPFCKRMIRLTRDSRLRRHSPTLAAAKGGKQ